MLLSTRLLALFFSRQYRHQRRRPAGRTRLQALPLPCNWLHQPQPLPAYRFGQAKAEGAEALFHYGDYMLGDENCPLLYGPADVRY